MQILPTILIVTRGKNKSIPLKEQAEEILRREDCTATVAEEESLRSSFQYSQLNLREIRENPSRFFALLDVNNLDKAKVDYYLDEEEALHKRIRAIRNLYGGPRIILFNGKTTETFVTPGDLHKDYIDSVKKKIALRASSFEQAVKLAAGRINLMYKGTPELV